MAIINPTLLTGYDTNNTNVAVPAAGNLTDGWAFSEIPKSSNMNYLVNELYKATNHSRATGVWQWVNTLAYEKFARVMRDGRVYWSLSDANTGNDPLSTLGSFWSDTAWNGQNITHNIAADADYILTDSQNRYSRITVTDTGVLLTVARNIEVSDYEREFVAVNDTAQILTFKTNAGTGIEVSAGEIAYLYCDGTNVVSNQEAGILSTNNFMQVQDQKTSGTNGGASVVGANIRTLNTILTNTITGASLAANQITLPAGTYYIESFAPAYGSTGHRARLQNVTDVTTPITGSSVGVNVSNAMTQSQMSGVITISASKVFSVDTYHTQVVAVNGLGAAITTGDVELYTDIRIWKVG